MLGHGGNVYEASRELGIPVDHITDFSASINPLGTPMSVVKALQLRLGQLRHYPDISSAQLAEEISKSVGVGRDMIICGNGSTELIYLVARALLPKRVLITAPSFSEYENAVNISCGLTRRRKLRVSHFSLHEKNDFRLDVDAFIEAMKGCDMAFICNPNNPTGCAVRRADVLRIAREAEINGCCLVVDEAFIDFIPKESVIKKVPEHPSLIVIRSMTKFYALSGLRLGYAAVNPQLLEIINRHKEPWTVNSLAQAAGVAALQDREYGNRTFKLLAKEKAFLENGFRRLGMRCIPSQANFYLIKTDAPYNISLKLRKNGILVRDCSNFIGLDSSYMRVAVRTRSENSKLLKELASL
ncbi:MAG TPA: threonine-phosphate decarboxylase CobD [Dissulfurispiraceae bacterium]|nr:threonine-phosphate decarboxylase CobD [Dissulfurispiraceae bacterium]